MWNYLVVAVICLIVGAVGGIVIYRRRALKAEAIISDVKAERDKALADAVALKQKFGVK